MLSLRCGPALSNPKTPVLLCVAEALAVSSDELYGTGPSRLWTGPELSKKYLCCFVLQRLWPSLNYGFSQVLGARYDTATADAWRRVYSYISMQMKRGMENPDIEPSDDAMGS